MADKELEIKLRATGGDAAAAEVGKLVEATEALNAEVAQSSQGTPMFEWGAPIEGATNAVDDLTTTVAEAVPSLEELTDASNDMSGSFNMGGGAVAKSGKGLMGWIAAAKGFAGPVALAVTALQSYWQALTWARDKLDEIKAASERAMPALASTSQAAALEAGRLADAEERVAEAIKRNDANVAAYTSKLRALANEQAALADAELGATLAQIDLDELTGNLSEAEAITARHQAKMAAGDRKLALEREQLERELSEQQQQNALEQQRLAEVSRPAAEAQGRHAILAGRGASTVPELEEEVAARNAAITARAQATTTDPEELDALDAAIAETQDALAAAYAAMVQKSSDDVDALVAKVREASDRVEAGRSAEASLTGQLENVTTGPAAQAEAARRREAELRMQAQQTRVQQAEAAARQQAEAEAARAASDAQAAAATEAANTAAREASAQAARMAGNAAGNGGVPASVVGAVENAAAKLADGTTEQEIAGVMGRIVNALEGVPAAQQSAMRAALDPLMSRLSNIESQLRNGTRN
jgi:hypothetical protein